MTNKKLTIILIIIMIGLVGFVSFQLISIKLEDDRAIEEYRQYASELFYKQPVELKPSGDNIDSTEISEEDRQFVNDVNEYINFKEGKSNKKNVKEVNYYVSRETNNPFIYKDKECTQMVKGAYRSIRKKTVKNGQILFNTIYCIKGELK